MKIIQCFYKYLICSHVDCIYIIQVSELGFQISIYCCHLLFHDFSHFLLTSFLPIHADWPRLPAL